MSADIIDGLYVRTPTYGTPFHTALTCLRCGAMIDGGTYTPVPPKTVHAQWHERIEVQFAEVLGDLQHRETLAAEAAER
jgi:hypothetical protein